MLRTLTLLGAMLLLPTLALADSTFALTGDLTSGGVFDGSLSLSTQGAVYLQGTYTNGAYSFTLPKNYLGEQLGYPTYQYVDAFPVQPPLFDLVVLIPTTNILTYTGGNLCTIYNNVCGGSYSHFSVNATGLDTTFLHLTATPISPTPEPSSFALLGTGLLCAAGAVRRHLRP